MSRLIAIDGLDGSGKGTQSEILYNYLKEKGVKVRMLSFPTYEAPASTLVDLYLKGGLGDKPEDTGAYAASVFFACDRYVSYRTDWEKDVLDSDTVVIANRYTTANAVHQLSKLPREEWEGFLNWLWDFEFGKLGLPAPDDVIYLEVPPEVSMSLVDSRGREKDIHELDADHLKNSYAAALYCSERLGWHRISCAPEGKMLQREQISLKIREILGV